MIEETLPTLSEFVSATILGISEGLHKAQEKGKKKGVKIHPDSYGDRSTPTNIEFDLSVASITQGKAGGGLKLKVLSLLEAECGKEGSDNIESCNRIHFTLPVHFVVFNAPDSHMPLPVVKRVTQSLEGEYYN